METAAAVEAKEAALEKMRSGDFSGARELAVEAQKFCPGMEGFDQMIVVCNVHCAAACGGGGDGKDWYKILDIAAEADEAAVRRQCGRMAVALHPDKNGLPGAAEAFQLIVEAKAVLGDSERRRVYDSMCRAKAMGEQWGFGFSRFRDSEESNGFARFRGISGENRPNGGVGSETNEPNIIKLVASGDDASKVLDFGFSRFWNDQKVQMGSNDFGGHNWENGFTTVQNRGRGRGRGRGSKLNEPNSIKANVLDGGDHQPKRPRGRPRGTGSKQNEPSSDKLVAREDNTSKVLDNEVEISNFGFSKFLNDQKFQMSSNCLHNSGGPNWENGLSTLQNRGRGRRSKLNELSSIKENAVASVDATTNVLNGHEVDKPRRPRGRPPGRGRGQGRGRGRGSGKNVEILNHDEGEIAKRPKISEPRTTSARGADRNGKRVCPIRPDSEILEYTDAEFNDFEQERSRECFKTGQMWAVYDTLDAMPRFYAMINGILDDHKLQITWLEPLPEDEDEDDKRWLYQGLPASSGRFKQGYNEVIQDYAVFSHVVNWKRDAVLTKIYAVRPQKGETWAIFKNWDTIRSQCLDFGEFEYEVVEIVSDYFSEFGVSVALLDRVEGFGCVFGRKEGNWEVIGVKDRLRFSHRIPSFTVCVGGVESFFELDPASLPKLGVGGEACR